MAPYTKDLAVQKIITAMLKCPFLKLQIENQNQFSSASWTHLNQSMLS